MLTITMIFLLAAFITAILAAIGRCPLWVSVILICIVVATDTLPLK